MLERPEVERRGPRVVEDHDRTPGAGGGGDRRHVLDLEGQRSGRLEVHDPRRGTDEMADARSHQGVVEGDLHAVAREDLGAELTGRPVHRVRDQQVVVLLEEGGERLRHRRETRGRDQGPGAAGQLRDGSGQAEGGRSAVQAVREGFVPVRLATFEGGHRRIEDRGGAVHGRVDGALVPRRVPARLDQPRLPLHLPSSSAHRPAPAGRPSFYPVPGVLAAM
jgi:hypothetical protein